MRSRLAAREGSRAHRTSTTRIGYSRPHSGGAQAGGRTQGPRQKGNRREHPTLRPNAGNNSAEHGPTGQGSRRLGRQSDAGGLQDGQHYPSDHHYPGNSSCGRWLVRPRTLVLDASQPRIISAAVSRGAPASPGFRTEPYTSHAADVSPRDQIRRAPRSESRFLGLAW